MPEQHVTIKLSLSLLPDGRCRARIDDSPTGASRGPGNDFELPALPAEGYPKFLKDVGAGKRPAGELTDLGKRLFGSVTAGSVGQTFSAARALAQSSNGYLRVAVCTLSPPLLQIPWEYFHDGNGFLLEDPKVNIVRVLDELPGQMAPFRPFTRLLLAVANPADMPRFDADDHLLRMKAILKEMNVDDPAVVFPATRERLLKAIEDEPFDAFYFLGHAELHPNEGGRIFLEDSAGKPEPLPASVLALRLAKAKNRVYFAYFNSCDTGDSDGKNTFSGVAQRVLANGRIPAVLAQQAPVRAADSMMMAETFLRRMKAGESPEAAVMFARSDAPGTTWGIPVLYTHLRGAEEFERNRIACLLSAEIGVSRFGIVLPSFGMGVRLDGQGEMTAPKRGTYELPAPVPITVTVCPPDTFVFPGETYARDDMESARDIEVLLLQVTKPEDVCIYQLPQAPGVTHWFLFGSLSSRYVATVLKTYSPRFEFRYLHDKWCLDELDAAGKVIEPTNTMPPPYHLGQRDFANQEDMGIIEKITDPDSGLVFFIIAGLGSRATRGCGWYLARKWEELLKAYGSNDFGVILKFPGGMPFNYAEFTPHRANTIPRA